MYQNNSLLGLVPARGGSKGLPNKNILDCAGRPLIEWTIAAARKSQWLDDVLVSTDSAEIAGVAQRSGAAAPFLRPPELATDSASIVPALQHAWENYATGTGAQFDYLVLLQPTSPLRGFGHIDAAIEKYFSARGSDADALVSVYEVPSKFGWLMQENDAQRIAFCFDVNGANPQRQKLGRYFLPNGAIYILKGATLDQGIYRDSVIPFPMSIADSADIDTRAEFDLAGEELRRREGVRVVNRVPAIDMSEGR